MSYPSSLLRDGALFSLVGLLTLGAIACSPNAAPPVAHTVAPDNSAGGSERGGQQHPLLAQLQGKWESVQKNSNDPIIFFQPNGRVFFVDASDRKSRLALEVGFRINPTTQPMQVDVTLPGAPQPVKGILELTPEGKLRIIGAHQPDQPRPTSFGTGTVVYTKVSETAELPDNVELMDQQRIESMGAQAIAAEGKVRLNSLNRAQQAYYLENNKFTANLDDLGLAQSEDASQYDYQILSQSDHHVVMSATARKPQLKSYLAVVLAEKSGTLPYLCETTENSMTAPPAKTVEVIRGFKCPTGSQEVN